jgi:hypothetical protein
MIAGARRAQQGLAPLAAAGAFFLPGAASEVWAGGSRVLSPDVRDRMVTLLPR